MIMSPAEFRVFQKQGMGIRPTLFFGILVAAFTEPKQNFRALQRLGSFAAP